MILTISILFVLTTVRATELDNFFLENAVKEFTDSDNMLDLSGLQKFMDKLVKNAEMIGHSDSVQSSERRSGICAGALFSDDLDLSNSTIESCLLTKCLSASDVLTLYGPPSSLMNATTLLQTIGPALLYQAQSGNCRALPPSSAHSKPTDLEVWGYGLLFVTVINLATLVGVLLVPCMKQQVYRLVLMFLVALAVGVLCGSALLFLIPEALGLSELESVMHDYSWKCMAVMGGIYLFFLIERLLRIVMNARAKLNSKKEESKLAISTISLDTDLAPTTDQIIKNGSHGVDVGRTSTDDSNQVAPVAWMIIVGDGLHNFIDGLAIGAAFTDSVLAGISISVAVICEEFPHELGDFAILLNAGMSVKRAVLMNLLSACCCYAGLCIGIILGALTLASQWIYAVAGGMFLYISLVDMMPEMNQHHVEGVLMIGAKLSFLIQNIGLLMGFGIMIVLAVYGEKIEFA